MARPREFNETVALDSAVQHFWRCGYEATSVRELAETMGITNASLYNAFGDKRALFKLVLRRYVDTVINAPIYQFQRRGSPRGAIEAFFRHVVTYAVEDADRKGCLLVNSALELSPDDAEVKGVVADVFAEIESFFRLAIVSGQEKGEIPPDLSPNEVARLLLGALLGIRVLARVRPNHLLLDGIVRSALAILNQPK